MRARMTLSPTFVAARWRLVPFWLGLLLLGAGCHRSTSGKSSQTADSSVTGDSVKKSLDALKPQLGELTSRFSALGKQLEGVSPTAPGYPEVRARFYAAEESRGITDLKLTLLANRLETAVKDGHRDELTQVSKDVAQTGDELRQFDQLYVTLLHQVMALERMTAREKEAAKEDSREATAAAAAPTTKHVKSQP